MLEEAVHRLIENCQAITGAAHVFSGDEIGHKYTQDPLGQHVSRPLAVVRPANVEELTNIVTMVAEHGANIVLVGGLTNLVGGCICSEDSIALSLERMNRILSIDSDNQTVTVEAGAILQHVQEAVEAVQLFLPLDLGSRGSATIGGTISTNAGGLRVLRWGMMRSMVMGLEVVMADGEVVSRLGEIIKDNAGYDWKHLFIGSEGTLGVVTKAVLRLQPQPTTAQTALIAMDREDQIVAVLRRLEHRLSGRLSSFELMWRNYYKFMIDALGEKIATPLPTKYRYYALIEALGSNPERDECDFQQLLTGLLADGWAEDVVVAQSEKQRTNLWAIREEIGEAFSKLGPSIGFDIGVPLSRINEFVQRSESLVTEQLPDATLLHYGHAGDGNLHVIVSTGSEGEEIARRIETMIYRLAGELGGSISAEHGIGVAKRDFIGFSRSRRTLTLGIQASDFPC